MCACVGVLVCGLALCHFTSYLGNSPTIRQWVARSSSLHFCLITTQTTDIMTHFVVSVCLWACTVHVCACIRPLWDLYVCGCICVVSVIPSEFFPSVLSCTLPYGQLGEKCITEMQTGTKSCSLMCFLLAVCCILVQYVLERCFRAFSESRSIKAGKGHADEDEGRLGKENREEKLSCKKQQEDYCKI